MTKLIRPSSEKWLTSTYKAHYNKLTNVPLLRFLTSSKGLLQEENNLPKVQKSDGFDLNAYKLMRRLGYDFSNQPSLGHVIKAKPYRLDDLQKMIKGYGGRVATLRVNLGTIQFLLVKISRRKGN